MWASSGPFPLSAHYGLYKRGRDPPTNPSRHLKKERSELPLKWLLKEDRRRRPTAASAAIAAAAAAACQCAAAAETAVSSCSPHALPTHFTAQSRRRRRFRPPLPPPLRFDVLPLFPLLHHLLSRFTTSTISALLYPLFVFLKSSGRHLSFPFPVRLHRRQPPPPLT